MGTIYFSQFIKNIKTEKIKPVYYIYGSDIAMVREASKVLIKKIMGDNNYIQKYDGNSNIDFSILSDEIQMFPMSSKYNCILINDWNAEKKKADENKKMNSIIRNDLNDTSVIIFNITGFDVCDGRTKPTAKNQNLISLIEKNGTVIICNIKSEKETAYDIIEYCNQKGCSISQKNAVIVAQYCLCLTDNIKNELDKICSYVVKGEIKSEIIEKLITKQENMKIYALTDSIIKGNTASVLHDYNILSSEMEVEQILYTLSDTFINWYRARTASIYRITDSEIQEDFDYKTWGKGLSFIVTNASRDCRNFSVTYLRKSIKMLCDAQLKINSNANINKNATIEETLIKIMTLPRR